MDDAPFLRRSRPAPVVLDGAVARWIGGLVAAAIGGLLMALLVFGIGALPLLGAGAAILGSSWKQVRPWLTRRLDGIAAP